MSSIRPLPPIVAAQIRSSATLVNLSEAVIGLVRNALDSGASKVHIDIDFARGSCTVEDNGPGILAADLAVEGNLARPFHTSKHGDNVPRELYGFRGVFLASLGAVSILSVVSRQQGDDRTHRLVILQGDRLGSGKSPSTSHEPLKCRNHGTRVVVQDLFGNMPVRIRQRPTGEEARKSRERLFKNVTHDISALVLAWITEVNIYVKGADQGQSWKIATQTKPEFAKSDNKVNDGFDTQKLCGTLTQLTGNQYSWSTWVQASARGEGIVVRGLISKAPSVSRNAQYISLGVHPLDRRDSFSVLYETINSAVASSSFGTVPAVTSNAKRSEQMIEESTVALQAPGTSHDLDRNPMYYIRLDFEAHPGTFQPRPEDLNPQDLASLKSILDLMIVGFLESQRLHPRKKRRKRDVGSRGISPASWRPEKEEKKTVSSDAFTTWNRMKAGIPAKVSPNERGAKEDGTEKRKTADLEVTQDEEAQSPHGYFSEVEERESVRLCQEIEPAINTSDNKHIDWLDERSGQRFLVNSRTGMIEDPPRKGELLSSIKSGHLNTSQPSRRLTLQNNLASVDRADEHSMSWAKKLAESWQNPVFKSSEAPIPKATLEDNDLDYLFDRQSQQHGTSSAIDRTYEQYRIKTEARVTQDQLRNAKVIAQVDSKFILASLPERQLEPHREGISPLILIDQHAADERVRLETLLQELCRPASQTGIATLQLEKPLIFDVSSNDRELLKDDMRYFKEWGIVYTISSAKKTRQHSKSGTACRREPAATARFIVSELPPIIAERCRLDPPLLRELIIKEARKREEEGLTGRFGDCAIDDTTGVGEPTNANTATAAAATTRDEQDHEQDHDSHSKLWLRRIHSCPRGLLDLVNSRACRSAIMFNDVLDLDRCRDLVTRLADTALPFQCAHGRPSLLPLASVDALLALRDQHETGVQAHHQCDDGVGRRTRDFAEAWKAWVPS